jgi:hypothetical protein
MQHHAVRGITIPAYFPRVLLCNHNPDVYKKHSAALSLELGWSRIQPPDGRMLGSWNQVGQEWWCRRARGVNSPIRLFGACDVSYKKASKIHLLHP